MTSDHPRLDPDAATEVAPAKDEFHTDKMILASAIVGVLSTLAFVAIVILNFLTT